MLPYHQRFAYGEPLKETQESTWLSSTRTLLHKSSHCHCCRSAVVPVPRRRIEVPFAARQPLVVDCLWHIALNSASNKFRIGLEVATLAPYPSHAVFARGQHQCEVWLDLKRVSAAGSDTNKHPTCHPDIYHPVASLSTFQTRMQSLGSNLRLL